MVLRDLAEAHLKTDFFSTQISSAGYFRLSGCYNCIFLWKCQIRLWIQYNYCAGRKLNRWLWVLETELGRTRRWLSLERQVGQAGSWPGPRTGWAGRAADKERGGGQGQQTGQPWCVCRWGGCKAETPWWRVQYFRLNKNQEFGYKNGKRQDFWVGAEVCTYKSKSILATENCNKHSTGWAFLKWWLLAVKPKVPNIQTMVTASYDWFYLYGF